MDFPVQADHRINLEENDEKNKYFDLARDLKKSMEHEGDDYTNRDWFIQQSN